MRRLLFDLLARTDDVLFADLERNARANTHFLVALEYLVILLLFVLGSKLDILHRPNIRYHNLLLVLLAITDRINGCFFRRRLHHHIF